MKQGDIDKSIKDLEKKLLKDGILLNQIERQSIYKNLENRISNDELIESIITTTKEKEKI